MKKQILGIGKALNKAEQKQINGGAGGCNTLQQCESSGCPYDCEEFRVSTGILKWYSCWVCVDPNNHQ